MNKNYLNLQQERDFGDVINATFVFLKQNFARILKAFLIYVAPFALLYGICISIGSYSMMSAMGTQSGPSLFENFSTSMLLGYLFLFIAHCFLYGVILEYMKLYRQQGPRFPLQLLGKELLKDARKIIWTSIVVLIILILASVFLLIPGIYLGVCFSIILPIRVLENKPLGESMNRCFKLIRDNWWWTFLVILIITILASVLQMVFGMPATIYQTIITLHMGKGDSVELNRPLMIFLYTLSSLGSTMLQILPVIGIAFQYFNLLEQKESPNLLKELETVGENE